MAEEAIVVNPRDSVAVALVDLTAGRECQVAMEGSTLKVQIREDVPFGHKFALKPISMGEEVIKYGEVIGEATATIEVGAWVHAHNLVSKRGAGQGRARQTI